MKPIRMKQMYAGLAACLLVASCASQPDRGTAQNTYSKSSASDDLDQVIGDRNLHQKVVIEDVRTRREGDRLHIQFSLRNKHSRNLPLEWTIVWSDGEGFELQSSQHWTPAVVGGKGILTIDSVAPHPSAEGFRLGLRKPNTVH